MSVFGFGRLYFLINQGEEADIRITGTLVHTEFRDKLSFCSECVPPRNARNEKEASQKFAQLMRSLR